MRRSAQDIEGTVHGAIQMLVGRRDSASVNIHRTAALMEDLQLDSLEMAELWQILEDELGRDPQSEGEVPHTVGDLIAFYQR
jgi:acyl carrier protein